MVVESTIDPTNNQSFLPVKNSDLCTAIVTEFNSVLYRTSVNEHALQYM